MEQINIKEYLQMTNKADVVKKKDPTTYTFTLVFDNGSDFIIEREAGKRVKRQLCFIANENLLYVRDPKTNNDNPVKTERQIKDFFVMDDNIRVLTFKNGFFNNHSASDFAYDISLLHRESSGLRRNFVKYGMNPNDYIKISRWGTNRVVDGLGSFDFDIILKVVKIIQEYEDKLKLKDAEYTPQINAEFLLFLCRLQEKFSIDYVRTFLEIYTAYDSKIEINMSNYYNGNYNDKWKFMNFEKPIEEFNLDFKRFLTYLFRDLYAEGIAVIDAHILESYYDCLHMQKEIYNKVKDKYPTHFKEAHDKVVLIYNLNKEYFMEKKVEALNAHNKFLEYSEKEYSIIVAKTSQDLIEEGINLHHCVGSYVNRVKNGDCSIFFLRKTDEIDKSLITIEIKEDKILQVRGLCERLMDDQERKFLQKGSKLKGLEIVSE